MAGNDKVVERLEADLRDVERRLRLIERWLSAALIVAVVFGIAGGFGTWALRSIQAQLSALDEKATGIQGVLDQAKKSIEAARDDALSQVRREAPAALKAAKGVRRCRICFRAYVSGGGDPGQCDGHPADRPLEVCGEWQNAGSDWTPEFHDDSDARAGSCIYRWRLDCESWD